MLSVLKIARWAGWVLTLNVLVRLDNGAVTPKQPAPMGGLVVRFLLASCLKKSFVSRLAGPGRMGLVEAKTDHKLLHPGIAGVC